MLLTPNWLHHENEPARPYQQAPRWAQAASWLRRSYRREHYVLIDAAANVLSLIGLPLLARLRLVIAWRLVLVPHDFPMRHTDSSWLSEYDRGVLVTELNVKRSWDVNDKLRIFNPPAVSGRRSHRKVLISQKSHIPSPRWSASAVSLGVMARKSLITPGGGARGAGGGAGAGAGAAGERR
ncbi:hypothetical protein EVAR_36134_1 [Eumeta japonica]|uniref:Uncharacterized protein n=1 Tax=Eumeta variegata TaxID=151549 RepID=A0A4C1X3B4_EUMVA|nr:hypothetical protein EVAR_36134_1 [Eumeta japonica]